MPGSPPSPRRGAIWYLLDDCREMVVPAFVRIDQHSRRILKRSEVVGDQCREAPLRGGHLDPPKRGLHSYPVVAVMPSVAT